VHFSSSILQFKLCCDKSHFSCKSLYSLSKPSGCHLHRWTHDTSSLVSPSKVTKHVNHGFQLPNSLILTISRRPINLTQMDFLPSILWCTLCRRESLWERQQERRNMCKSDQLNANCCTPHHHHHQRKISPAMQWLSLQIRWYPLRKKKHSKIQ